jgi:hypothetical protein
VIQVEDVACVASGPSSSRSTFDEAGSKFNLDKFYSTMLTTGCQVTRGTRTGKDESIANAARIIG